MVSKVKLTCSTDTCENNMTDLTTDEAPGCGAAHFSLFGKLHLSGVRSCASPSAQMSSDCLAGTRCTATTIPISQHSATDLTTFKSVLLWSVRKVARVATDWSRCRSCACDVTALGVSLEHVQTTLLCQRTRTPDTLRKWVGCKLLLANYQRRTQLRLFDSKLAVFHSPICGNWRQGGHKCARRYKVTIDLPKSPK